MREQGKGDAVAARNVRTGLVLGAVAALFFVAVFVKHIWFN